MSARSARRRLSGREGRPAVYCGAGCRRIAERRLERLEARLRRAHAQLDDGRRELGRLVRTAPGQARYAEARIAAAVEVAAALELELDALLRATSGVR